MQNPAVSLTPIFIRLCLIRKFYVNLQSQRFILEGMGVGVHIERLRPHVCFVLFEPEKFKKRTSKANAAVDAHGTSVGIDAALVCAGFLRT